MARARALLARTSVSTGNLFSKVGTEEKRASARCIFREGKPFAARVNLEEKGSKMTGELFQGEDFGQSG